MGVEKNNFVFGNKNYGCFHIIKQHTVVTITRNCEHALIVKTKIRMMYFT